jgi:predicted transcriptional regulator
MSSSELTLHIGIASREAIKRRTIAIAKGELRPTEDEPRIWFSSLESLAKVLSEKNMLLLEIIRNGQPRSFTELSKLSGRAMPNLSRTLHGMERLGLVEIRQEDHRKFPVVRYDRVAFDMALGGGEAEAA